MDLLAHQLVDVSRRRAQAVIDVFSDEALNVTARLGLTEVLGSIPLKSQDDATVPSRTPFRRIGGRSVRMLSFLGQPSTSTRTGSRAYTPVRYGEFPRSLRAARRHQVRWV